MKHTLIKLIAVFGLFIIAPINVQAEQEPDQAEDQADRETHKLHRDKMMKKMRMHQNQRATEHLSSLDTNDDGKVSLEEYLSNAEERFNKMDIDGDHFVTSEEARDAHQQMREKQRASRKKNHQERQRQHKESKNDSE